MKHSKIFSTSLCILLIACNVMVVASGGYKHHYAQLSFKSQNNIPNVALTAYAVPSRNTNPYYKNNYSVSQQFAAVINWIQQLYPNKAIASLSAKKTLLSQQAPIKASAESPSIPEAITHQKYSSNRIAELENQFFIYQHSPEWDRHTHIINQRINALEQIKSGNQHGITKNYTVSKKMRHYGDAHAINTHELEQCTGNTLQQTIHDEFINITKKSARIWHKNSYPKAFKKATSIIADFTDAGIAFNKADDVRKALALADACWMILDCIQAAGEGLVEGVYHTGEDIIHPVRTLQSIADGIATCGYYIGKVAIEIGELGYLIIADHPQNTYQKLEEWSDTFAAIYKSIKENSTNLKARDVIKETISFGTQLYATPKALHGIGKLFKYAHKNAIKLAENVSKSAKTQALATPEGIIIRIADSAAEFMKNEQIQPSPISLTVPKFIQENRIPIDKETILIHSNFRKTKIPPVKGAQVYTKDSLFYHRDTLHKGKRAHLEVYNKKGLHLGEADVISGQLIPGTADKTKHLFK
jgi:hypothetical protein